MKYKVKVGENSYKLWLNDVQVYDINMKPVEDVLKIHFDPTTQLFSAKVLNPSLHTQYLLSEGRLGMFLTKKIMSTKSHLHRSCYKYFDSAQPYGYRYTKYDDEQGDTQKYWRKKSPTRMKYYPRWSRINPLPIKITDLNDISFSMEDLIEQANEASAEIHNLNVWPTYITLQGILCTTGLHNVLWSPADRAYRTRSNTLTLRHITNENDCIEYGPALIETSYELETDEQGRVCGCTINFDTLTGWFLNLYDDDALSVKLKIYGNTWGIGTSSRHSGATNRGYHSYLMRRRKMQTEFDDIEEREKGHAFKSFERIVDSLHDFHYQWDPDEIKPKQTILGSRMYARHQETVIIEGTYSVVLCNKRTGTVLHHVVNDIPYRYEIG